MYQAISDNYYNPEALSIFNLQHEYEDRSDIGIEAGTSGTRKAALH